jgi:hypothetical protein
MNLNEELNRIKQVMGLNESKTMMDILIPVKPKSPLHHYSTYKNRKSIQKNGLIPKIGRQTLNYLSHNKSENEPIPMIFAQDTRHGNFFGVYGSDIWEIDLEKAGVNWYKDPIHKDDGNQWDFYVTLEPILPSAIKLVGSNEQRDDDIEVYRQTGEYPNRNPIEEPEKPKEVNPWEEMLGKVKDDETININWDDINK